METTLHDEAGGQQYNDSMKRIAVCLIIIIGALSPSWSLAVAEEPPQQPSAKQQLNQVLGPEGGIQVYKDHHGNVESTINLPNGERIIKVQPPQSPGFNTGPPLQLNNRTLQLPPPPPASAQPPAPEFPQRAR
ncbi:MAG: hypothetical protein ACT4PN_01090 [Nitrospiraceae bacterium]